jgi:hypothetical protein
LLYGFNFFAVVRKTHIANGLICRDVERDKWVWEFDEPEFSKFNSD